VHGNTCEIEEDVWLTPADVITRDEVEQPGGEVLLMMLEVAVVEGKGKGSMLRRLSNEDRILDGGLFIYLFRGSEEAGRREERKRNASSVYVQSLFQFNTKFPHCSELTLDNTTQHSHFSPEANRCVSRRRKKDCDLSGFCG
jgi:hypothetical protein